MIGLGMTSTSREYAIKDLAEAREYLKNDVLRTHYHMMLLNLES